MIAVGRCVEFDDVTGCTEETQRFEIGESAKVTEITKVGHPGGLEWTKDFLLHFVDLCKRIVERGKNEIFKHGDIGGVDSLRRNRNVEYLQRAGDSNSDSAATCLTNKFTRCGVGTCSFELLLHGHRLAQHRTEIELI